MTDEVKGQAEHLSKLNDVRVAVLDLYKGKIGVDAEEASHVSSAPISTKCFSRLFYRRNTAKNILPEKLYICYGSLRAPPSWRSS